MGIEKRKQNVSVFTKLGFFLVVMGISIQLIIGLLHINDPDQYSRDWSTMALMEALFAGIGLISIDLIRGQSTGLVPKKFKKIDPNMFLHLTVILGSWVLIQIVLQLPALSVRDAERAFAIIFAAPCEEVFFRGFLISIFITLGRLTPRFKISKKRKISFIEITGILLSGLLFGMMHVNYYNMPAVLWAMVFSGIVIGFWYWYWDDLTAAILAHFILNIISVWQTFFILNL